MITCQDARHLFSRYLDGDLPSSLKTELHAHQLNCPSCRDELSMLETCGDVIALDLCEPKLSESFTDRVLAARQAQLSQMRPHRRGRMVLYAGSSLAAAASIALVFFMFGPWVKQNRETAISGVKESAPVVVRQIMRELGGVKEVTPQAQADLAETEEMPLPDFYEAMAKFLHKTQNTFENTRQSFKDLELLLYLAIPDTKANPRIIEQYRVMNQGELSGETSENPGATEVDPGDPSSPNFVPSAQPDTDNAFDAL